MQRGRTQNGAYRNVPINRINMQLVTGPACLVSLGIDLGTHVAPCWQISHVLCQATSKLQIQPFRFFCRYDLTLAWTASLAFRLALEGFRFFAKWLPPSIDLCCIAADMARKLWSGMLLDHRLVNLLPQTIARKFLKRPRKRGFRRNLSLALPAAQPPQIRAILQVSAQHFRSRKIVNRLGHESLQNGQPIIPLAPDSLPPIRAYMFLNFCQFDHPDKLLLLFCQRIQFFFQPREKRVLYAMPYVEKWAHSLPLSSFFIHRNTKRNLAHSPYIFNDLCKLLWMACLL